MFQSSTTPLPSASTQSTSTSSEPEVSAVIPSSSLTPSLPSEVPIESTESASITSASSEVPTVATPSTTPSSSITPVVEPSSDILTPSSSSVEQPASSSIAPVLSSVEQSTSQESAIPSSVIPVASTSSSPSVEQASAPSSTTTAAASSTSSIQPVVPTSSSLGISSEIQPSSLAPVASSSASQAVASQEPSSGSASSVVQGPASQGTSSQSVLSAPPAASSIFTGASLQSASSIPGAPAPASASSATTAAPAQSETTSSVNWLPTTLVTAASTKSGDKTASSTQPAATSSLPKAIAPDSIQDAPSNYELITVGFKEAWNYPFVVKNSLASAQIFEYLPKVLNHPFDYNSSNTSVLQLVPMVSTEVQYIITVAEVYFPSSDIAALQKHILNASSPLYKNDDATAAALSTLIDPSIPLTGLLGRLEQGSSNSGSNSNGGNGNSHQNTGAMEYSSSVNTQTPQGKGRLAAVTIGSVVGGTVYISLLIVGVRFFINRKRVALASRSGSILPMSNPNDSTESFNSVQYGAGVRLPSSSTPSHFSHASQQYSHQPEMQQVDNYVPRISAPVATQNSLGWSWKEIANYFFLSQLFF